MTSPTVFAINVTSRLWRTAAALFAAVLLGSFGLWSRVSADSSLPTTNSPLVISEIQTGGCTLEGQTSCTGDSKDAKKEFIELRSQQSDVLDVRGWHVQYFSNSGTPVILATLEGVIAAHGSLLIAHEGYYTEQAQLTFASTSSFGALAESSGHVQIVAGDGSVYDHVGWGSATQPLVKAAKAPAAGKSLQRMAISDTELVNTATNFTDFTLSDIPTPRGGDYMADLPSTDPDSTPMPTDPVPAVTCEGVVVSEILPNPAGTDSGHEFIELHNPTNQVITLTGCSLQSGTTKTVFNLPAGNLQPGEYRIFSDADSGITLANSAGGNVWLLTPSDELQAVTYGANLGDDVSWALVDGSWGATYTPTPGSANTLTASEPCPTGQERNPDTNRCQNPVTDDGEAAALTPCKAGQERNPDTNRCRNIASAEAALTACKAGQTRNPETNRCAATGSTGSQTACKAGQERNPETNRCRNIAASASTAKACPTGQERNPDTNRCRKGSAAGSGNIAKVQDVKTPVTADPTKWLLIGAAIVLAIGYAIFEWRQEIAEKFNKLFRRSGVAERLQTRPMKA